MASESIKVKLRADSGELRSEFKRASKSVKDFSASSTTAINRIAGMGAAFVGLKTGGAIIDDLLSRFDRIGKISTALDEPVEDIQRLGVAAEFTGTNLEKIVTAGAKLDQSLGEASKTASYAEAFRDLNLETAELKKAGLKEQIDLITNAYAEAEDKQVAYAALTRLIGRGAKELLPLLKAGTGAVDAMTTELKVLSDVEVRNIELFNDRLLLIKRNLESKFTKAFAEDLDEIGAIALRVGDSIVEFSEFLIAHRDAIKSVILAYAGFKIGGIIQSMAVMGAAAVKSTASVVAQRLALVAETTALNSNSVAQRTNAATRGGLGKVFSKANLSKIVGLGFSSVGLVVAAAIAGWEIGSQLEKYFEIGKYTEKALDATESTQRSLLSQSRARIEGARSELELKLAIADVEGNISVLQKRANETRGKTRSSYEYALQQQQNLLTIAGKVNEAAREHEVIVNERKANEEAIKSREAQLEKEREITAERERQLAPLREEVEALSTSVTAKIVDLGTEQEKIAVLERQLKSSFGSVSTLLTDKGYGELVEDANDLAGLSKVVSMTRNTDPQVAKTILNYMDQLVDGTQRLGQYNDEINSKQRAQQDLAKSLAILQAQAQGNTALADQLQRENDLLALQEQLMESAGLTREQALDYAEQRLSLEDQIKSAQEAQTQELKQQTADARDITKHFAERLNTQIATIETSAIIPQSAISAPAVSVSVASPAPQVGSTALDSQIATIESVLREIARNTQTEINAGVGLDSIL